MSNILVTGASGFIGHHLVNFLKGKGNYIRAVDWKEMTYQTNYDEFDLLDLRSKQNCKNALRETINGGITEVYALAADMGGMGFIQDPKNQARILYNNTLINFHTLEVARNLGIKKYLYSSSACIYPDYLQKETNIKPLKEIDAYPAMPQDSYGWEKLQAEHLMKYYQEYGMETRTARFHNIYGPEGSWIGGREKAPAALCRKVIEAVREGKDYIEIWGDGEQTRSFCYINDCTEGIYRLMHSDFKEPLNIGRDDMISINELARLVMSIAGVNLRIKHVEGPIGVRGRNSDNDLCKKVLGWEPSTDLKKGMEETYNWIRSQVYQ